MDFYDMSRANSTGLALTKDFEISYSEGWYRHFWNLNTNNISLA